MGKAIRLTINDEMERMFSFLHAMYPGLDRPEILKLSFSSFYNLNIRQIPVMELTKKEVAEVQAALDEVDRGEVYGPFSAEELIEELNK